MTAVALAFDLGATSTHHTLERLKTETDAAFLNRVVASHRWQRDDVLEVHCVNGRLSKAVITTDYPARIAGKDEASPALRNAAQHLIIARHGQLVAVMTDRLRPIELRAAARPAAGEDNEAFVARLWADLVEPLKERYPDLGLRTETHVDVLRRKTVHVVVALR